MVANPIFRRAHRGGSATEALNREPSACKNPER